MDLPWDQFPAAIQPSPRCFDHGIMARSLAASSIGHDVDITLGAHSP